MKTYLRTFDAIRPTRYAVGYDNSKGHFVRCSTTSTEKERAWADYYRRIENVRKSI